MTEQRLTRRFSFVAVGRGAMVMSLLAVDGIMAHHLQKWEAGTFKTVWFVGNMLVPLFYLGLPTCLLYFFPRLQAGIRRVLVRHLGWVLGLSGALLAGLLYGAGPFFMGWLLDTANAAVPADPVKYLVPFLPYVFASVASGWIEGALVAAGKHVWQAALNLGTAIFLVAAAVLWALNAWGVVELLAIYSLMALGRLGIGWMLALRAVPAHPAEGRLDKRLVWRYSVSLWLNDAAGALSRSVDRLVIGYFFSVEAFAEYQFGAVELPINLLLAAAITVLVPEVSQLYRDGKLAAIAGLWRGTFERLSLLVLPVFFFFFVFAESFIQLWLGSGDYARTPWVFRIFLMALPLRCAVYNPVLAGMGKTRWVLWGGMVDLVLNLCLSITLVYQLGGKEGQWAVYGPALATVAATYVHVGVLVGLIAYELKTGFGRLVPWASLARRFLFFSGAAGAAHVLSLAASTPLGKLALGGPLFLAIALGALWLHPFERAQIRQMALGLRRR